MILQNIARSIRQHDWFVVIVELLVVIIGLVLAFQIDRWRVEWDEHRQEQEYVTRLKADIEADIPAIQFAIDLQTVRLGFVELLMDTIDDPESAVQRPAEFLAAVNQAAFTYSPSLASHTFEDLRSTGNMRLIRKQALKDALYKYYGFDKGQLQYRPIEFTAEFKHFELVAGVLNFDQSRFVQDVIGYVSHQKLDEIRELDVDVVEVLLAAHRLAARPGLKDWLPQIRRMQKEHINVNGMRLDRARAVLEIIDNYSTPQENS